MTQWILTSSVLILLVIAVRGLFKEKMKAKYTYALWLLVLVRLLCPVNFGELSFNLLSLAEEGKAQVEERLEEREEEQSSQQMMQEFGETVYLDNGKVVTVLPYYPGEVSYEVSEQVSAAETVEVAENNTIEAVPVAKDSGFQFPEIHWQKVLPVVWAVGMVVIALVIVSVNISFSTMLGLFRKELPTFTRKGRGSQKLSVYLAEGIYSSCLYGVVRPSIYLNRKGMGEQEKKYCIEHEYSHYLQGDMVWSVCRIVCLILHWYNPLVWLAVTLSKKDAELACDERTIERLGEEERYSYGHTLVELAANQSKAVQMFGMVTLMASDKKEVVNRVKAITTKKQTKIITGLLVACLLVGIGCFVFTGVAKGEQENNKNAEQVVTEVTETPVPTVEATAVPTVAPEGNGDTAAAEATKSVIKNVSPTPMPVMSFDTEANAVIYDPFVADVLANNEFPVQGQVIANKLNVRSGAGTEFNKLTVLSKGTEVTIHDVTKEKGEYWYLISYQTDEASQSRRGFVKSCYITWAGEFRLYESPEENSAYTTLQYYPELLRGIVDAGSEWFYTETPDYQSGWVKYGEHGGVDARIRNALKIVSASDWDIMRETEKQKIVYILEENVNYTPLSFVDHVALEQVPGEGWSIDLNGDGESEKLYINADGVYVNGEKKFMFSFNKTFWLLDIDTTDKMYELLTSSGNMYIYDGKEFQSVKGIRELYFAEGSTGTPKTFRRYFGTLNEFTRIDEHTISFEDHFHELACFFAEAQYTLDENHGLQVIPQEYDILSTEKEDYTITRENDCGPIKVYEERDLSSAYTEAMRLHDVNFLKSDCVEWVYIEAANGISSWMYYGGNESQLNMLSFNTSYNEAYFNAATVPLRLYKEKDVTGEYEDVAVTLIMDISATRDKDGSDWFYITINNSTSGWVKYGDDFSLVKLYQQLRTAVYGDLAEEIFE